MDAKLLEKAKVGDVEARKAVVEAMLPDLKHTAWRLSERYFDSYKIEELISMGVLGIFDAIRLFNPSVGVSFRTYACKRIAGSMFDEARRDSPFSRKVIERRRAIKDAESSLFSRGFFRPRADQYASELGMGVQEFLSMREWARTPEFKSLDDEWESGLNGKPRAGHDFVPDKKSASPFRGLDSLDLERRVQKLLRRANMRERLIINLVDGEGWTLKRAAKSLGISESRACQLRASGIRRVIGLPPERRSRKRRVVA